jgi:hypothetical protein
MKLLLALLLMTDSARAQIRFECGEYVVYGHVLLAGQKAQLKIFERTMSEMTFDLKIDAPARARLEKSPVMAQGGFDVKIDSVVSNPMRATLVKILGPGDPASMDDVREFKTLGHSACH